MTDVIGRAPAPLSNDRVRALRVVVVVLSALLLAAHVLRQGFLPPAVLVAASPLLLLTGERWGARVLQLLFVAGAIEWVRTTLALVSRRLGSGAPYLRMAAILGSVALVTALAAALLHPPRRAAAGPR
jgi:hypothetical protein